MPFRHSSAYIILPATILAFTTCLGCSPGKYGRHTNELRQQSREQADRFRAATEWDVAQQYFQTGDLKTSLDHARNAARLDPENPLSRVLLTRIYIEQADISRALAASQEGLDIEPNLSELWYYRGMAFERGQSLENALQCYQNASELNPDNPHYALAGAEVLIELNRLDDARMYLLSRSDQVRFTPAFRATLAHIELMEGRVPEAVALFREASILAPQDDSIREDLARALIMSRRFAEAEPHLAHLCSTANGRLRRDLQVMHARCLLELDRPVDARRIALSLTNSNADRSDPDLWALVADVALKLGDNNLLFRAASRMIALNPSGDEGHIAMAIYHRRTGNLDLAYASAQNAAARSDGDESASRLLELLRRERPGS